ncbi:MAG: helix-turn-helix transcriptional regulator [Propionibacteriaceae bacterium]|nr:helix-turn-helix transcriptional regulator [Propionibacteriaceae bacterium]
MTLSLKAIAETVRTARTTRAWSQTELAKQSGLSRPTIARIEAGQDVSLRSVAKVGEALQLDLALVAASS